MVRVPEKVFDFEFLVYAKRADLEISGWQSLDPYVVGIVNGWKIVERNTTGARLVTRANDYEQLFDLLQRDRVDVAVLDRVMGGWKLQQLGFDIAAIEPPILRSPMFVYVHESRAELVPRIASVVAQMKTDGSFAAIYENALPGYLLP